MAISSVIERGSFIFVYDDQGHVLFSKSKGSGTRDGLVGFTGATVTMRYGSLVHTYDEHGMTIYSKAA
jgi:hypothetical protein